MLCTGSVRVVSRASRTGPASTRCAAAAPSSRSSSGCAVTAASLHLSSARSEHRGIALRQKQAARVVRCRQAAQSPQASFLGVGAPEAFVVAVVALIVFGPKGLAEVAKSVGKTLRSFQPTIQELQSVSREFQNALKEEIYSEDKPAAGVPPSSLQAATPPPAAAEPKAVPPTLSADAPKQPPASSEGGSGAKQ